LRKTRSPIETRIGRGKAWNGRVGQAFALVELGVVDGDTANSSPRTAAGHKQDDQTVKTKPPTGSCSRILDQGLGPTRVRSSRSMLDAKPSHVSVRDSEGVGPCKSPRVRLLPTAHHPFKAYLKSKGEVGDGSNPYAVEPLRYQTTIDGTRAPIGLKPARLRRPWAGGQA
jgi:hypothetical protein